VPSSANSLPTIILFNFIIFSTNFGNALLS
jgi:hypothetical protein